MILPTLDGHGEEYETTYISTEDTADKLISYIDENCSGHLFALCGVSLGGQIVMELLSRKPNITKKQLLMVVFATQDLLWQGFVLLVFDFGGLLFSEKACRFQIAMMPKLLPENMQYPDEIKAYYMTGMPHVRKETFYNMYRTYMMSYTLKENVKKPQHK